MSLLTRYVHRPTHQVYALTRKLRAFPALVRSQQIDNVFHGLIGSSFKKSNHCRTDAFLKPIS